MTTYSVYLRDRHGARQKHLDRHDQSAEDAAAVIGIDEAELEWAIEECGRCDGVCDIYDVTIVPNNEPCPEPY